MYLDSASAEHNKNIKITKPNKSIVHTSALNNYGLFFLRHKKQSDSALIYFNQAYKIVKDEYPNAHLIGSIRDNIADIYLEQNKPIAAKQLYFENFVFYQYSSKNKDNLIDVQRLISAGAQLIETNLKLGDIIEAERVFFQLNAIINDNANKLNAKPNSKLEFLKAKELLYLSQNKTQEAYQVSKRAKHFSDSIVAIASKEERALHSTLNELTLDQFKLSHQLEKAQKEVKIERQRIKLWIITISSLSILGFFISIFLRRRQHIIIAKNKQLVAEQKLKYTALKNKQLHFEIEAKKRDLSDFAINLHQNQEWAKILASKLEILKSTKGRERKKMLDEFERDIKNKISFDIDTKEFYQRLDKLSDLFYKQLNTNFPNLSKSDKRLCSLIRLKIDSNEIATLQNITLSSLNTSRYRLRRKLNLPKNSKLDDFIENL